MAFQKKKEIHSVIKLCLFQPFVNKILEMWTIPSGKFAWWKVGFDLMNSSHHGIFCWLRKKHWTYFHSCKELIPSELVYLSFYKDWNVVDAIMKGILRLRFTWFMLPRAMYRESKIWLFNGKKLLLHTFSLSLKLLDMWTEWSLCK